VVIGARQHALAILGHDGAHRLACRNRFINDLLTCILCFWPIGAALGGYRRFHFGHHRLVGTSDDPELLHKEHAWLGQWQTPLKPWRLALQLALDFCGGALPHFAMAAYLTRPASLRDGIGPAATIIGIVATAWWFNFLWIPALWFASLGSAFFVFFRLRLHTWFCLPPRLGQQHLLSLA
jgi:fatty acid desaturase